MENNLILRRLRYALSMRNRDVQGVMSLGGHNISDEQVRGILHRESDPEFTLATVKELSAFLDGLIIHKRGKRELAPGQKPPAPILATTNNMVLRKLRIAFDLKEQGMLDYLRLGGFQLSKAELSALFRKEGHKHYRECGDQVLRYFVGGLTKELRPTDLVG
ncbi:MAG: DUF1456 family protein [Myxococcales bacterium]|nr:DUF1456 family protein [Myxococcales bacterium]